MLFAQALEYSTEPRVDIKFTLSHFEILEEIIFDSHKEILTTSCNQILFLSSKIVPLISIEYPKAATANHNQYFRRDTTFCPIVFVTNKQTQKMDFFVFLHVTK